MGTAKARKRKREPASEPAVPRELSPLLYRVHLAAACALVALLALHRYATVMSEPGGRFEDPDAMFHAHRVVRTIAEGTLLPPVFDPFENFPDGGRALWPPLHDATLALMARLGGSTAADPRRGLPVAAAFPVLEVALALLVAAALARRCAGPRAGVVAAWLFALTPCLPRRGSFGDIDHNLTEVLAALLLLLLADTIARREEARLPGIRDARLSPFLWAGAVLLALGFYAGLVLAAGIVAAGAAARDSAAPSSRALPRLSLGFGLSALLLPVFASWRVTPVPDDPWRLGPVFVLVLALGATGTALVSLALAAKRGFSKDPDLASAAGLAAGTLAFILTSPRAWPALARGFGFLGARDPWLATIDEFRPLFESSGAWRVLLPAVPVAVAGLAFAAALRRRHRLDPPPSLLLLVVPFAGFLALGIAQKRFLPLAAAFGAAAGGAAWGLVREAGAARWTLRVVFTGTTVVVANAYLINYLGTTLRQEDSSQFFSGDVEAGAVRKVTPEPGNPPAWGVLAPWADGHFILWKAGRAVALNNFGTMQPGFARAEALWLEPSPRKAVDTLSRLRLRYVVASWPPDVLPAAATVLGRDPSWIFDGGWAPSRPTKYFPTAAGSRTLLVRLHLGNAAPLPDDGPEDRAALARFRLAGASEEQGPGPSGPVPLLKIFELLPEAATASR